MNLVALFAIVTAGCIGDFVLNLVYERALDMLTGHRQDILTGWYFTMTIILVLGWLIAAISVSIALTPS